MKLAIDIEKLGIVGVFVTAILSPCCFPLFAFAFSALGLGSFELFGGWTMWVFQAMVVVSLVGFGFSYQTFRNRYPLLIALPSAALIFYGYHIDESDYWQYFLYVGMLGLLGATIVNYYSQKSLNNCSTCATYNGQTVELKSTITCPNCQHQKVEMMPTNACQYFYDCEKCATVLKPKAGDCCVFCSYGTVKCPPIQAGSACCN
jgi:MerC mercury resistance protein